MVFMHCRSATSNRTLIYEKFVQTLFNTTFFRAGAIGTFRSDLSPKFIFISQIKNKLKYCKLFAHIPYSRIVIIDSILT